MNKDRMMACMDASLKLRIDTYGGDKVPQYHKDRLVEECDRFKRKIKCQNPYETTTVMRLTPKKMPSTLRIACFPMGLGKTVITVFAMQMALLTEKGANLSRKIFRHMSYDQGTGFHRESGGFTRFPFQS